MVPKIYLGIRRPRQLHCSVHVRVQGEKTQALFDLGNVLRAGFADAFNLLDKLETFVVQLWHLEAGDARVEFVRTRIIVVAVR